MNYKGIELKEFTSDKPVAFDPPKKMLVWDDNTCKAAQERVCAFVPNRNKGLSVVICKYGYGQHCAEIPEELAARRATNLELAKWLANGNGQVSGKYNPGVWMTHTYAKNEEHNACDESTTVRKWADAEWHEPTIDYMGLAK